MNASDPKPAPKKRRYVRAVGPRLQRVLAVVFGLFALLAVNSAYLLGVRLLEAWRGETYQNWFYLVMFLIHLALGLLLVVPVLVFGIVHMRNTYDRRNRRAVYVGYALFATALVLLGSGFVLTRVEGIFEVKDPTVRSLAWWLHVLTPLVASWLFVLHRLAGKKIRWKVGARWAVVAALFAGVLLVIQAQDPRRWNVEGPESGEQYFFPSLSRTATGDFIPASVLANDRYCLECHEESHRTWEVSAHRFSSFNNPPYRFAVEETRRVAQARDDDVHASRFCAGCHDPVPFFSGRFDNPDFDGANDPTGQAGITCTVCHAITHVNSVRGNGDYTIEEPIHYPFAFSDNGALRYLNEQLVKAKPELHKRTFLKPLHRTAEFCGACHKVHLPEELNDYKWLRGQNHYDSYHLSGVSGHGIQSFYYPEVAESNCNGCHMPLEESDQFGAQDFDASGTLTVHDHQFPSANTGIPHLLGLEEWVNERHRTFNEGVVRVDLFGLRRGATVDGELLAPLRPEMPALEPGETYLLDAVIRTLKMGHPLTQGTADSNELWLEVTVRDGERIVGRSGTRDETSGAVDRWAHFVNVYMLDFDGKRMDRRNAQDIFVPLYNHQIPPGASDVIHYRLQVPSDAVGPLTVEARLLYRKFDTTYLQHVYGPEFHNDLPILTLAEDRVLLPVRGGPTAPPQAAPEIPAWQRWNDYGIGLLRKGGKSKGELRQAEEAFQQVEEMGQALGALNLARVYIAQGTVQDRAIEALRRAASFEEPAYPWSVAYFTGVVNRQNGFLDEAIAAFTSVVELDDAETRRRGFDFSQDYRLLNELGETLFERARQERGEARKGQRDALLGRAQAVFDRTLELEPENVTAHYNLALIAKQQGDDERSERHFAAYRKYRPDDNARDSVVAAHRRAHPAADQAAEAIVIYDLHREPLEFGHPQRPTERSPHALDPPPNGPSRVAVLPVAGRSGTEPDETSRSPND